MKSGFVAVAGKPNVGKSTLINALMKRKVVIVSDKPQTTRNRVNCILNTQDAQIVLVDTPGIHKPLHKFGEYMVKIAVNALKGQDLILFLIDPIDKIRESDLNIAKIIKESKIPTILVINKIDSATPEQIKEAEERIKTVLDKNSNIIAEFKISALTGENLSELLEKIIDTLPEGPQYYPEDMTTDRPLAFMISELIREKIFHLTSEEIPHSTAVVVEEITNKEDLVYIRAEIYIERQSQKGIIIGQKGRMIKKIGMLARKDIEMLLDDRVYLDLYVKVKDKWRQKDSIIMNTIGLKNDLQ
ncbi:GTP-binding protein Era [Marinitoga hydrogenitolerans DSM 16785]|uniref:GTPase Era n=1 Tax=Marinitoga hydrogenitolerans (strain DSM 16785 / JCM 12826 / AT1271) TaxID=1122195 RepID=A0A1M4YYN8_MARH1|nr:GTPase Era [Marinitoga hydrogenitolerans]SHF10612.1 GTP-binding protein Era [Marinitoga hydrogenitolerans DSM 16785]